MTAKCDTCGKTVIAVSACPTCCKSICLDCKDHNSALCAKCSEELSRNPAGFYESFPDSFIGVNPDLDECYLGDSCLELDEETETEVDIEVDMSCCPFEDEGEREAYEEEEQEALEEYFDHDLPGRDHTSNMLLQSELREKELEIEVEKIKQSALKKQDGQTLTKSEILYFAEKYEEEHYNDWVQKEIDLGRRMRKIKEITLEDLVEINEWKFKKTNPDIWQENLKRILKNSDSEVRHASRAAFLEIKTDKEKIERLYFHGVGNSLASVILTFYDPWNYGVFDKHVWQALFGELPKDTYEFSKNPEYYMRVLNRLRLQASGIMVRRVEQAYFKKHFDKVMQYKKNKNGQ